MEESSVKYKTITKITDKSLCFSTIKDLLYIFIFISCLSQLKLIKFSFIIIILVWSINISKAESINEFFMRMKYDEICSFDKIEHPSSSDSVQYLKNLSYATCNYCDSTTISYHKDLVNRIYSMQSILNKHIPSIDEIAGEIIGAYISIFSAENEPFQNDDEAFVKLHTFGYNAISNLYPSMNDDERVMCITIIAASYLNENTRERIVDNWLKKIDQIKSYKEYAGIAELMHPLSSYLSSNGEQESATRIEESLNKKCQKYFWGTSDEWLDCLLYNSIILFNANNYEEALSLLEKVLAVKETNGIPDRDLGDILRNLRHCCFTLGRYHDARNYAQRLLDTYDVNNTVEYLNDASAYAYCIFYSGDQDIALKMLTNLLLIEEKVAPENSVTSLGNLSTLYRLADDMVNSMKYGELSIKAWERRPSDEYNELFGYYAALVNLGAGYYTLNDIPSSMAVLKKAASLHRGFKECRKFDRQRVETDIILWAVLARDYIITNNPNDGKIALDNAMRIAEEYYGDKNINYLKIYAILADLKLILGDNIGALQVYENVLDRLEKGSKAYYGYLSGYSDYCVSLNRYEDAYTALTLVYPNTQNTKDLIKLSRCEYWTGRYDDLEQHLRQIFELNRHDVNKAFLAYNDIQRRSFWWGSYVGNWFQEEFPTFVIKTGSVNPLTLRTLYDATIFSKGIILSMNDDVADIILNSDNGGLKEKYARFLSLMEIDENSDSSLDYSILTERAQIESELMRYVRARSKSISALDITSVDIQQRLDGQSVAIEFIAVQTDTISTKQYYALVLEPNERKHPNLVKLFNSDQFDAIDEGGFYTQNQLTHLIWLPLKDYLTKYHTVYFSPAGVLNNIAIESLPSIFNDGYICDTHSLIRLSNTREIVSHKIPSQNQDISLFGGMLYSADLTSLQNEDPNDLMSVSTLSEEFIQQNRAGHSYLPGSKDEVVLVDSLARQYNLTSSLHIGMNGNENVFKRELSDSSPNIIHIATHGLYYSKEDISDFQFYDNPDFLRLSKHNNVYTEDLSLTQSALLFSGSNTVFNGEPVPVGFEDGVLTAYEISTLNLNNTDMVILSACQTGLGELKGDGVFGLQRGFKKAGVNSILMSLWEVDDKATQKLMTSFYNHYLSGMSKVEALRTAQKDVRGTSEFEDPYYWAAFILLDALN